MQQFYSLRKIAVMLSATFISYSAISQTSSCGPIIENFDNTGGTMAGFSSTVFMSTSPGFTYGITGSNGYLQRCNVTSAGTAYAITSPTYHSLASSTTIGWGFTLSGLIQASKVEVYVQYIPPSGGINSVSVYSNTATAYNGSGADQQLVLCETTPISNISGFTAGQDFRILAVITAKTGSTDNTQCMTFDNFRVTGTISQITLPVAFLSFGAQQTSKGIELIWNVAGETDVQSYIVERSSTGGNFLKLGEIAANQSSAYAFLDNQPLAGMTFYRIKEVEVNGSSRYSPIVRLNLDRNIALRAYPSPATSEVTIEHSATEKGTLSITTADGRVVKQIEVKPQMTQTFVNTSTLKAGLYVVRFVTADGKTQTTKLIKQ
ncbi:MAG: T9SS type A sorting domain-containing protein [Flavisolibacter sp.]